jgi:eukaryotic-like serine/threonine-protein kinase
VQFPQRFGRYLLVDRLSSGGMAEIFVAKSMGVSGFQKIVAIKRIHPWAGEDSDFTTMFIDEAKISARLSHVNIGQVFEFGQVDGQYFLALEYIPGKDVRALQAHLGESGRFLPVNLVLHIGTRLCQALDYAHRQKNADGSSMGIIHRDISPPNVLISYEGAVKLIDFGIAKAAARSTRTRAGRLKGKIAYMAPEQVAGAPVDHRCDIFSLGILLHEILAGRPLFQAENQIATMNLVRRAEVPPPSTVNPEVPLEVDRIILRALARDPEERYAWASEMRADIEQFMGRAGMICEPHHLADWMRAEFAQDIEIEARLRQKVHGQKSDVILAEKSAEVVFAGNPRAKQAPKAKQAPEVASSPRAPSPSPAPPSLQGSPSSAASPSPRAPSPPSAPPARAPSPPLQPQKAVGSAAAKTLSHQASGAKPGPQAGLLKPMSPSAILGVPGPPKSSPAPRLPHPGHPPQDDGPTAGVTPIEVIPTGPTQTLPPGLPPIPLDAMPAPGVTPPDTGITPPDAGQVVHPAADEAETMIARRPSLAPEPKAKAKLASVPPSDRIGGDDGDGDDEDDDDDDDSEETPSDGRTVPDVAPRVAGALPKKPAHAEGGVVIPAKRTGPIVPGPNRTATTAGGALEVQTHPKLAAVQEETPVSVDGLDAVVLTRSEFGGGTARFRIAEASSGTKMVEAAPRFTSAQIIFLAASITLLLAGVIIALLIPRDDTEQKPAATKDHGSILITAAQKVTCTFSLDKAPRGLLSPGASTSLPRVPVGLHEVSLRCPGFAPYSLAVRVQKAQVTFVEARLQKE